MHGQGLRTGTDNVPIIDYPELEIPTVIRSRRESTVTAMRESGVDPLDIPSFLRRQAD